ncbi:MAG TPA: helix-turn-helix transcriptional regulator [Candidatus Limnocylindrales bacterium]|nr:helix-turn-helix transcriptional regulator [Candidatus Limnocylindrales bacterium]
MDLGQRIHRLRVARGLTQRELAEPGYTAAYVSSVESGKRTPSSDALHYFAERLGTSLDELTGRTADTPLDLAFASALASGAGFDAVAAQAHLLGDSRWEAWARLELDPVAHLEVAAQLLADAPPLDRLPVVLARAAQSETRYAIYLLERLRDELTRDGYPSPDARHALQAHLAARFLELGDEDRAAAAADEALSLTYQADPAAYLQTAQTLLSARHRADATVAIGQSIACYRRAALTRQVAACHRARGRRLRDTGDLESAANDLSRARDLYGDCDEGLDVAVELAEVQRLRGLAADAQDLIAQALSSDGHPLRAARAHRELGLLALAHDDSDAAESMLRHALTLYEETGPARELARTLSALSDLLSEQGRLPEAAELLRTGLLALLKF